MYVTPGPGLTPHAHACGHTNTQHTDHSCQELCAGNNEARASWVPWSYWTIGLGLKSPSHARTGRHAQAECRPKSQYGDTPPPPRAGVSSMQLTTQMPGIIPAAAAHLKCSCFVDHPDRNPLPFSGCNCMCDVTHQVPTIGDS